MNEEKQITTTPITIIIAVVQLLVVIFYLAWKIPNKEDITRIEQRIESLDERFDTKMSVLGQNYINHLSVHHVVSSPQK